MRPDVSIVVACYNEQSVLEGSIKDLEEVMERTSYNYEIIFVDDCSKDATRDILIKETANRPNMRYIFHEKNTGCGRTVLDGLREAQGKIVGFVDIDLEVHAHYLLSFILAIEQGYDISYGYRLYEGKSSFYHFIRRGLSIGYMWLVNNYLGLPYEDTQCGFKFFNKETMMPIIEEAEDQGWVWDAEVMALAYMYGKKAKPIRCIFRRRFDKKSSLKIGKDTLGMARGLIGIKKRIDKKKAALYKAMEK